MRHVLFLMLLISLPITATAQSGRTTAAPPNTMGDVTKDCLGFASQCAKRLEERNLTIIGYREKLIEESKKATEKLLKAQAPYREASEKAAKANATLNAASEKLNECQKRTVTDFLHGCATLAAQERAAAFEALTAARQLFIQTRATGEAIGATAVTLELRNAIDGITTAGDKPAPPTGKTR